jgi:hypothetical protein
MKKLLVLLAAIMAFTGGRSAGRARGAIAPQRLSFGKILSILLAPSWLRVPLLVRAVRTAAAGRDPGGGR